MFRLRKSTLQVVNSVRNAYPRSFSTQTDTGANGLVMNVLAHGHYDGIEEYEAREIDKETRPVGDVTFKFFRKGAYLR